MPTGGIGFFDSVNDQEVAALLFDTAKEWLEAHHLEAMDGPVNPGMRDAFWGCLVDGFHEPVFNMPYNFPYYQELFEGYGFKNYFNQYTYQRTFEDVTDLHPVVFRTAKRILSSPDYQFKLIEKGNRQFAIDFRIIYNKAWSHFAGTKDITDHEAITLLKTMEPVIDERLVIFGYYKGEPIGFFIMMPDIGQITKKFDGKFHWYNKLRFFWYLKVLHRVDRVIGRIFGVIPEFQNKGVEGALILFFQEQILKPSFRYKTFELNWIGDFNPVMMKVAEFIGGSIYKTHVTYRFLFDRNAEFKRAPLVNQSGS
jgi:GNAT superfamily N-acetyltransferase